MAVASSTVCRVYSSLWWAKNTDQTNDVISDVMASVVEVPLDCGEVISDVMVAVTEVPVEFPETVQRR